MRGAYSQHTGDAQAVMDCFKTKVPGATGGLPARALPGLPSVNTGSKLLVAPVLKQLLSKTDSTAWRRTNRTGSGIGMNPC